MGDIYAKDKPEANSFLYVYAEGESGAFVRVAFDKLKELLGVGGTTISAEITLTNANWVESSDGSHYTQVVTINGINSNSKIDLQPTPEQIIQLMTEEITLFMANDEDGVTAYAVNGYPSTDMTISVLITEMS